MSIFRHIDNSNAGKAREELINQVLPKVPITGAAINDKILESTRSQAIEMLKQEIEVYKAFPRKGVYKPDEFNPRNSRQCFMGQGFTANGNGFEGWTDYDLVRYRTAVGTIAHEVWGNVTLLEIWGGDHFKDHKKMVKDVFLYCNREKKKLPKIDFYINPFNKNDNSGTWEPHADEIYQKANREHLIKIANYCEIRNRMKKAKVKNPMMLAIEEKDDPKYTRMTDMH